MRKWKMVAIAFVSLSFFMSSDAWAYIDPGTGSFILQILAAGMLVGFFMIKRFWRNFRDTFDRLASRLRHQ